MRQMMRNETGSILPLMIAITFVVAYLLLMFATQIEVKVASYERTRSYMTMNLLEREGLARLEEILLTTGEIHSFSDTWILNQGAVMHVTITRREAFFDFSYQIMYNANVYSRNLSLFWEEMLIDQE